ncbi:MAG: hypothetical protein HKUEN07_16020 [Rhodocyclaceae bacterium]|nr:MAG: hypothetical protein HKUEN07_16020 [Rhodocyclaceae bacterium]
MSDLTEQFRERVLAAAVDKTPLRIRGGGTKDFYGNAPAGELLDTTGHAGLVAYEPTELVVTVRAGTRLAELEAALAEKGQMLAFEPPHFSPLPAGERGRGRGEAGGPAPPPHPPPPRGGGGGGGGGKRAARPSPPTPLPRAGEGSLVRRSAAASPPDSPARAAPRPARCATSSSA